MHYGYGYGGDHWGLWMILIVAMAVFLGALAWIIVTLLRHQDSPPATAPPSPGPTGPPPLQGALDILNERFARGEIGEEEYTRRRSLIEGSG